MKRSEYDNLKPGQKVYHVSGYDEFETYTVNKRGQVADDNGFEIAIGAELGFYWLDPDEAFAAAIRRLTKQRNGYLSEANEISTRIVHLKEMRAEIAAKRKPTLFKAGLTYRNRETGETVRFSAPNMIADTESGLFSCPDGQARLIPFEILELVPEEEQ